MHFVDIKNGRHVNIEAVQHFRFEEAVGTLDAVLTIQFYEHALTLLGSEAVDAHECLKVPAKMSGVYSLKVGDIDLTPPDLYAIR